MLLLGRTSGLAALGLRVFLLAFFDQQFPKRLESDVVEDQLQEGLRSSGRFRNFFRRDQCQRRYVLCQRRVTMSSSFSLSGSPRVHREKEGQVFLCQTLMEHEFADTVRRIVRKFLAPPSFSAW